MGRAGKSGAGKGSSGGGSSSGGSSSGRGFGSGGGRSFLGRSGSSPSSGRASQSGQDSTNRYPQDNNAFPQTNYNNTFPQGGFSGIPSSQPSRGGFPVFTPPIIINNNQRPMGGNYMDEPGMQQRQSSPLQGGANLLGCLIIPIVLVVVFVIISIIFNSMGSTAPPAQGEIRASTIKREALPAGAVNETAYYTDGLGWIKSPNTLVSGMQEFYKQTGVQPHLLITDNIYGNNFPTDAQAEQFAGEMYDKLFTDEAHVLVIFFEYEGTYHTWAMAGIQAKTVLDDEAINILLDYIDLNYYGDLSEEQMFGTAFASAGTHIMEVTTSPWIPVFIVIGVLVILLVIFLWWRNHKKQKNLEAEQTEAILAAPLQKFSGGGGNEASELAEKYSDKIADVPDAVQTFTASETEKLAEKYKSKDPE